MQSCILPIYQIREFRPPGGGFTSPLERSHKMQRIGQHDVSVDALRRWRLASQNRCGSSTIYSRKSRLDTLKGMEGEGRQQPRFRKLRIAWSVWCVIACVLLVVLWLRSYWRFDEAEGHVLGKPIRLLMASGHLRLDLLAFGRPPKKFEWSSNTIEQNGWVGLNPLDKDGGTSISCKLFNFSMSARRTFAWMPFSIAVLLTATLAGIPWITAVRRFSLRTLLIATTLVAVVLGIIAYSSTVSRPKPPAGDGKAQNPFE
jgi:hypothetical protein